MQIIKAFIRFFVLALVCYVSFGCINTSEVRAQPSKKDPSQYVPHQLIVKFKSCATSSGRASILQKYQFQVIKQFQTNGALLLQLPNQLLQNEQSLKLFSQQLASLPELEYAEPNWIVHSMGQPNGPLFDQFYALSRNSNLRDQIFAQKAWSKTTGSSQVLVAVIDSGIDYNHQDLAGDYWHNAGESGSDSRGQDKRTNGIDDDHNGKIDDWRGWNFLDNNNDPMDSNEHGTHCAGTIGAVGNKGVGITGANGNVSLVGLKFINRDGVGSIADAISAVEYAISIGAHVINNSWGGDEYSETMAAVIRKADAAGIVFVVAAGNDSNNNDIGPDYPASYPIDNIISVAAVDGQGQLASFSNYGPRTVHIAAPGVQILSTVPGNDYARLDGTSMAAPYVSGAAALIKARFPQLNVREIKARLLGGATPSAALQPYVRTGLLNIDNALNNDFTPPPAPQRVRVLTTSASFLDLEWDYNAATDGDIYGFDVRYSQSPINSESEWQTATAATIAMGPSLSNQKTFLARVNNFPLNSSGYLQVRAYDRSGNWSPLTTNLSFALQKVKSVYANRGDSLEGITINGSWDIENLSGVGRVLSDSPGGTYGFDQTTTLTLAPIEMTGTEVILTFATKHEFELGYDFGYLEVSTDQGASWFQMAVFNGSLDWTAFAYSITPPTKSSILIRFRITSDRTTAKDGWYLANLAVYSN